MQIFKLHDHLDRLFDSAKSLSFQHLPTRSYIINSLFKTLQINNMYNNIHIRLTLTRGIKTTSSMNPNFNTFGPTLLIVPEYKPVVNIATYDNDKGVRLITASNRRNPPQCLDSKIHHNNLLNNSKNYDLYMRMYTYILYSYLFMHTHVNCVCVTLVIICTSQYCSYLTACMHK